MKALTLCPLLFLAITAYCQEDSSVLDLKYAWFVHADDVRPIIGNESSRSISFMVPSISDDSLKICNSEPFDVWLNGRLIYSNYQQPCVSLFLNSVAAITNQDTLIFRVQSKNLNLLSTILLRSGYVKHRDSAPISKRTRDGSVRNFLMMHTLGLLIFLVLYKRFFANKFNKVFEGRFTLRIRDSGAESGYGRFIAFDNLFTLLFVGLFGAGSLVYLDFNLNIFSFGKPLTLSVWLILAMVIISFLISRFLLGELMSAVFNVRGVPNVQAQDFSQFMILTLMISSVFIYFDFSGLIGTGKFLANFSFTLIVLSIFVFQFWFYLKFARYYTHRKLMIITYLCTTEILPGFLACYWLLK